MFYCLYKLYKLVLYIKKIEISELVINNLCIVLPLISLSDTYVLKTFKSSTSIALLYTLCIYRLQKLEETFYQLVDVSNIATKLELTNDVADLIYVYWKLKRRVSISVMYKCFTDLH